MSDLGVVGSAASFEPLDPVEILRQTSTAIALSVIQYALAGGASPLCWLGSKDTTLGNPTPPSLKLRAACVYGPFQWPVEAGVNTLTMDIRYGPDDGAGTRPRLRAQANDRVGLHADLTAVVAAGADTWHSTELTFTARQTGNVAVFVEARNLRPDGPTIPVYVNVDNLVRG